MLRVVEKLAKEHEELRTTLASSKTSQRLFSMYKGPGSREEYPRIFTTLDDLHLLQEFVSIKQVIGITSH